MTLSRFASIGLLLLCALDARAALTVSVEPGPDRVRPNEPLTAQLTVANDAAGAVAGVVLTAPVPAGVNSFNPLILTGGGTCAPTVSNNGLCDAGEVVSWSLGTIPGGGSVTVLAAMTVANGTAAGTVLTLQGGVSGDAVTGSASSTVDPAAALTLAVDDDADPVASGGLLT